MKYAVNDEGVAALKGLAAKIEEGKEIIKAAAKALSSAADEHSNTLGPHQASIVNILEEIQAAEEAAAGPVESIAEKLNDIAEAYQDVIDNDRFSHSGN